MRIYYANLLSVFIARMSKEQGTAPKEAGPFIKFLVNSKLEQVPFVEGRRRGSSSSRYELPRQALANGQLLIAQEIEVFFNRLQIGTD
jgi:hypothetical protein